MLDTATGNTWLLRATTDESDLSWSLIRNDYTMQSRMIAAARSATDVRVDVETFPKRDIIVLRGKKSDVDEARAAINEVENAEAKSIDQ